MTKIKFKTSTDQEITIHYAMIDIDGFDLEEGIEIFCNSVYQGYILDHSMPNEDTTPAALNKLITTINNTFGFDIPPVNTKKSFNDNTKATLNFLYFSMNYTYEWEKECFKGNDHIINKYQDLQLSPMRFIFELSRTNQLHMLEWVQENYLAFPEFKIENE